MSITRTFKRYETMKKLSNTSINQMNAIFDFIQELVYKDELKADSMETVDSARSAVIYLAAYRKTDENTQPQRDRIVNEYVELNEYYKELQDQGIPPHVSRLARDFDIIYQNEKMFIEKPFLLYYRGIYRSILNAFYLTSYSKAFESKDNYRNLCLMVMNLNAIMDIVTKWLENPFDIDLMDSDQLDKFMISFGIPFFTFLPVNYKRNIASNLNRFISRKGTDQVVIDILDIFNFTDIDIFKYYLAKDTTNNDIASNNNWLDEDVTKSTKFLSHNIRIKSLNDAIKKDEYRKHSYEIVTENDPFWKLTKSDAEKLDFDVIQTKFFSIETGFEIAKESLNTVFLINLLKRIHTEYPERDFMELTINNISESPISLSDLIIAIQILTNDYNGSVDMIHHELAGVVGVYDFAKLNDPIMDAQLFPLDSSITLTDLEAKSSFGKEELLLINKMNLTSYNNLINAMKTETNYERFRLMQKIYQTKFIQKLNYDLYAGYTTYYDYIRDQNNDLADYINEIREVEDPTSKRVMNERALVDLINSAKEYLDNFPLFFGSATIGILIEYLEQVINTFKSFTVSLRTIDTLIVIKDGVESRLFDNFFFNASMTLASDLALNIYDRIEILSRFEQNSEIFLGDNAKVDKEFVLKDNRVLIDKIKLLKDNVLKDILTKHDYITVASVIENESKLVLSENVVTKTTLSPICDFYLEEYITSLADGFVHIENLKLDDLNHRTSATQVSSRVYLGDVVKINTL